MIICVYLTPAPRKVVGVEDFFWFGWFACPAPPGKLGMLGLLLLLTGIG
jgi:hypothetical protein